MTSPQLVTWSPFDFFAVPSCQDVFDLPFHMARDQIEESLRTKMASIKVEWLNKTTHLTPHGWCSSMQTFIIDSLCSFQLW